MKTILLSLLGLALLPTIFLPVRVQAADSDIVRHQSRFDWKDVTDEPGQWIVTLFNERTKNNMTVDVTPRRCQQFKPQPGAKVRWHTSTGAEGTLTVDKHGLVTVPRVMIQAGKGTQLFMNLP